MRRVSILLALAAGIISVSCGYHVGGQADLVPKSVQTISVPRFNALTTRYKLVDVLPQAIAQEFSGHTRFHIANDPSAADAVLNGTISRVYFGASVIDPPTGKATTVQITVVLSVNLIDRRTGRILYSRSNWSFRESYQYAIDAHQFFDESGPALDRLGRDVARDVVSSVVENF